MSALVFDLWLHQDGLRLPCRVSAARRLFSRLRGLLGRPHLEQDQALSIAPCDSVHTFGMRYAIDVVFVSSSGRIIKLKRHLTPRRMSGSWGCVQVLELSAGGIDRLGLEVGRALEFRA